VSNEIGIERAAEITGAKLVRGSVAESGIGSVVIDSRQATQGALFAALPGENTDGHHYVDAAFNAGAAAALVTRELPGNSRTLLVVPDTMQALWRLASWWRKERDPEVTAITGSVGKTSVKEMVAAICSKSGATLATSGNYNNELGVPLTLLRLQPAHQFAVVEIGMRGAGQIAPLVELACPDTAVITNIGLSHIELLGSQEAIARAKGEIFSNLQQDGTAVLPRDTPFYELLLSLVPPGIRIVTFTARPDDPADVSLGPGHKSLLVQGETYALTPSAAGAHVAANAACAVATGLAMGLDTASSVDAVNEWRGAEGRMHVREDSRRSITVLDDCYNAGQESTLSALATLQAWNTAGRRVAVLGDMRELGDHTVAAHQSVGNRAAGADIALLVTVGEFSEVTLEAAFHAGYTGTTLACSTAAEAAEVLNSHLHSGDVVLVKGSRAVGLEVVVEALTGQRSSYHG
jgi:UDP-N-acetylmuramoyl-tripeptide--D-alanyl-D-alanine ligase